MEKISSKVTRKTNKNNEKAEKGTVTIRQRGNSFEARIRLELKKGGDKNPRLSRSGPTEEIAKQRLAQLIIDTYIIKQNYEIVEESVFSDNCEENLKSFSEYRDAKEDVILHKGIHSCINFYDFAVMWLNYKKEYVNPSTGKTISPKTVETYAYTLKKHIKENFPKMNSWWFVLKTSLPLIIFQKMKSLLIRSSCGNKAVLRAIFLTCILNKMIFTSPRAWKRLFPKPQ